MSGRLAQGGQVSAALEISVVEPGTILIADLKRDPELICRAAGVNKATAANRGSEPPRLAGVRSDVHDLHICPAQDPQEEPHASDARCGRKRAPFPRCVVA